MVRGQFCIQLSMQQLAVCFRELDTIRLPYEWVKLTDDSILALPFRVAGWVLY